MMHARPIRRQLQPGEEGYILVAVIFLLAILIISLAVAAPKVREDIQRDREVETMHRGKQYARAIKLYYKKFNAYPPNIDALVKTNEIRFLRKRYTDPMTGKDDWKPIMFGQNKTPVAMGFFGQPLAGGSTLLGIGPSGGNDVNGATPVSGLNGSSNGSASSNSGSAFGSSGGSAFGSSGGSAFGSTGGSSFGQSGGGLGGTTTTGTAGTGTDTSGGASSGSGTLSSNQTFGGGGIIGFSPGSEKPSILIYKKKNHYNEWEFLYSPLADQMMSGGNAGTIGQPAGGINGNGTSGSGTSGIGSGFPINPGGGPIAPSTPTTPTTPQQ